MATNARVRKLYTFDAAHQLTGHKGKCAFMHGHTYTLELVLRGPIQRGGFASDEGFVIDFGDMSAWMRQEVIRRMDHRFLNEALYADADGNPMWGPPPVGEQSHEELQRMGYAPIRTTAERMCEWLWRYISRHAPFGQMLWEISLWETPTSCATITAEDVSE